MPIANSLPSFTIPHVWPTNCHAPAAGQVISNELFCLGDKPFGVEPGCIVITIDHATVLAINKLAICEHTFSSCADFAQYCRQYPTEAKNLAVRLQQILTSGPQSSGEHNENIKLWLIKQTYQDPGTSNKVTPPLYRLVRTNTFQRMPIPNPLRNFFGKIYQFFRQRHYTEENYNAICECLATNIARLYGMQTQRQSILLGEYKQGEQIVTTSLWEAKLESLEGRLAGSINHQKYIAKVARDSNGKILKNTKTHKPILTKTKSGYYLEDNNTIADLGMNLPLFLQQNDRDCIGSMGQNKGLVDGKIFGFDFGQSFRDPVLPDFAWDFSVKSTGKASAMKNVSIFEGAPLSHKMAGMLLLYKMSSKNSRDKIFSATEQWQIEKMIFAYKIAIPGFAKRIDHIIPGSEEAVFTLYQKYFAILAMEKQQTKQYTVAKNFVSYVTKLEQTKKNAVAAREKLLHTFKDQLLLTPAEVDLLDGLNKFSTPTSALSPDSKMLLQHLRILPEKKPNIFQRFWNYLTGKKSQQQHLTWSLDKLNNNKIQLKVDAHTTMQAQALRKQLSDYFAARIKDDNDFSQPTIEQIQGSNNVVINCSLKQLQWLQQGFQEKNVLVYKCHADPQNHPAIAVQYFPTAATRDSNFTIEPKPSTPTWSNTQHSHATAYMMNKLNVLTNLAPRVSMMMPSEEKFDEHEIQNASTERQAAAARADVKCFYGSSG